MNIRQVADLFEYNRWANQRIMQTAASLTADQFRAPVDFPFGTLRGTLVHTFDGEYSWRMLLQEGKMTFDTPEADFPNLGTLQKRWKEQEAVMQAYLAGLKDDDLAQVVRYTTASGVKRERVLWHCLFHLVNHGTQHGSESAAILTKFGQSPGDMDFTVFLNERK